LPVAAEEDEHLRTAGLLAKSWIGKLSNASPDCYYCAYVL